MRKFGVTILQNLRPRWNFAPSQQALIISRNGLQNEAMMAQWGMPPASAKHSFLINARSLKKGSDLFLTPVLVSLVMLTHLLY